MKEIGNFLVTKFFFTLPLTGKEEFFIFRVKDKDEDLLGMVSC